MLDDGLSGNLERAMGIEPTRSAWKADVLPLNYARMRRVRRFGGGPVGISTLAVAVNEERETVEEVAEPFLVRLGFLARTPRGRIATPAAWTHLGLRAPEGAVGDTGLGSDPGLFDVD